MSFFVYRFVDPIANEVFYVGKGSGERIQTHFSAAKRGASGYFYNRLRKLLAVDVQPEVEYIWECDNEAEALQKEKEFIAIYGRRLDGTGTLCNITTGGEGCALDNEALAARNAAIAEGLKGRKLSCASIKKIAETKRRQYAKDPDLHRKTASILAVARKNVDESKRIAAVSKACAERVWSVESRKKLSESCKGRRYGPDVIERMRHSKMKAVLCHNTGDVFQNGREAAKATGVGYKSVWRICNGKSPSVKGLVFSYKEN
jgi:hypothetical protein